MSDNNTIPGTPIVINNDNNSDWQSLINSLVSLDNKGESITTTVQGAADLGKNNIEFMKKLNETLSNILNNISTITSKSTEIVEALKKGKLDQYKLVDQLSTFANTSRQNEDEIKTLMKTSTQISKDIEQALNNSSAPSVGGKRRRTRRNKGKKYHKRTKRGGFRYKKEKKPKK